jgi:hypothetical protein
MTVVDTGPLLADEIGSVVANWCRQAVAGDVPIFRAGWYSRG